MLNFEDKICTYIMGNSADDEVRLVVLHLYYSSDVAESVFMYENTLIYKLDGENTVVKVNLE